MDRAHEITEQLKQLKHVESVIVYGPDDANLMIVTTDLEPATLRALADPVRWWIKKTASWPRLFTAALINESLDVFPIEMLELSQRRRVLHGPDPFVAIRIDHGALRIQCERELREKMMRLREAYVEHHGTYDLVDVSRQTFARIFRACLVLFGIPVPADDDDVIKALCTRLDLDAGPFFDGDFERYYRVLSATEARIDRLIISKKEKV